MPILPSGRKVAIDPGILTELLEHSDVLGNVLDIMEINSIPKVMEWCEVAFYVTADEEHDDDIFIFISENSLPPPPGHFLKRTGCPLSQWENIAHEWSEEDRVAMKAELSCSRFQEYLESQLALVMECQDRLLSSDNPTIRMIAGLKLSLPPTRAAH